MAIQDMDIGEAGVNFIGARKEVRGETMTFDWAVRQLADGKEVCRLNWRGAYSLRVNQYTHEIECVMSHGEPPWCSIWTMRWVPSLDAFTGNDWVEVPTLKRTA